MVKGVTKSFVVALLAILMSGCGTFTTLTQDDRTISRTLIKGNTHCTEISRVYSGAAYDICILNSHQPGIVFEPLAVAYVVDALVCTVTDTLLLPFTLVRQHRQGNLEITLN
jgi:uncharacterized protein YceK